MAERYCPYHRGFVVDEGFRIVVDHRSNTTRGMCPACQAKRRLPRAELQALADRDRAERAAQAKRIAAAARERKPE
ncbi:hypothetical protein H4CHR_02887 [Variovorax sp. PBS-H4]|nr:hypothetical protein H4CHR_02887 [Variovorax sp. PBS-H4]